MGIFKKKRRPLDSLHVDPFAADQAAQVQDNVPGPDSLGFEAIETAEAASEEASYLARSSGVRGIGSAAQIRRAELSIPRSEKDPADD